MGILKKGKEENGGKTKRGGGIKGSGGGAERSWRVAVSRAEKVSASAVKINSFRTADAEQRYKRLIMSPFSDRSR